MLSSLIVASLESLPTPRPDPATLRAAAVLAYFIAAISPNMDIANVAMPTVSGCKRAKQLGHLCSSPPSAGTGLLLASP